MTSAARFRLAVLPLVLYVALEPALALDTVARLLARAEALERGNLLLLLFYELTRALRSILGLVLVALLLQRSAQQRAARALTLFLLFGLMAYGIAFAGNGYVGPFQDWLTRSLLALGIPRQALLIAFGYPDWALWLALAALLRFAVLFPAPLTSTAVAESGVQDRQGLLRGVPGAGVDIGSAFRRMASVALGNEWLAAQSVWMVGVIGALTSVLLRGHALKPMLWLPFFLGFALAITCLRASYMSGDADSRERLLWMTRGSVAALACCALSGMVGIADGAPAAVLVFILLTLAPGALLLGIGMAVLQRSRSVNVALIGS